VGDGSRARVASSPAHQPRRLRLGRRRRLGRVLGQAGHALPVITGQSGTARIFQDAADLDLQLLETRTLDDHIHALVYRPHPARLNLAATAT
jgi:hypothetical protein